MTGDDVADLIASRLAQARDALADAQLLADAGRPPAATFPTCVPPNGRLPVVGRVESSSSTPVLEVSGPFCS